MPRGNSLNSILGAAFPQGISSNLSDSAVADDSIGGISATKLLEAFIPGYGPIHKFVLYSFGFDVTILVSLGAVLWLGHRISVSLWAVIYGFIMRYYTADITIYNTDEIHAHLIQFLAHVYEASSESRRLMAETPTRSAWELDSEESEVPETLDADGNITWLNFSNQDAKMKPRFTPAIGSHNFWHNRTYFHLVRKEETVMETSGGDGGAFKEKEVLTLSCYGRSTEPIKELIEHAKTHYHLGHNAKTVIKRPAPKELRRYSRHGAWVRIANRPCRPISTVVLDEHAKLDVLRDINEYLSPSTARWYANRGIPYRRGYLFHGPPGTGKTSLTFALAGIFGLDIHVVSLLEPTLTEEDLGTLFTHLPARSIVLLEDIDTAGLLRVEKKDEDPSTTDDNSELSVKTLAKAFKKANEQSEEDRKKGISLSGLLNVIDGVSSQEGRVLVMTTNHPENLDEALIRPGRVDHQVAFGNATKHQVRELFERMYTTDVPRTSLLANGGATSTLTVPSPAKAQPLTPPHTPTDTKAPAAVSASKDGKVVSKDELLLIASQFADSIPDALLSPAEIQGFLLKRKKDPRKALAEVREWVEGMVEQKKGKSKIVKVQ